ncbi:ROK family protein, partial [Paenibacillus sp. 598K]|uniref:ROK family protein n=1 Tax=Paenibacillus sp. 598K TaxID=1117987 RepID=UPI0011CEFF64
TGIGGALYLDGRIYRGAGAAAGEIGYSVIAPPATLLPQQGSDAAPATADGDLFGQFEQIASGTGIGRLAREHLTRSDRSVVDASLIVQLAGGAPEAVNARHVLA